uniref:Protein FAM33A n=1 Tax=Kalanchoe fedtschenkoi TaxID=63787 RepID=A0A7N0TAD7_KALFE
MERDDRQQHHHHQSTEGLVSLFTKSNRDLIMVQNRLEKEFQQIYPHGANPMKLVSRIKRIQEELLLLKQQCQELLTAKQELIDKASSTLVGTRATMRRMQASLGIHATSEADDVAYSNFKQVVDEWSAHVRSKTGGNNQKAEPEDINQLLFSTIVHNN